jgi:pyruvate dehydrogenase E1 component beta subunit
VVAWQDMLRRALAAAELLAADGIDVEIVDPVTLNPFDVDTLVASVRKTGACVVVEEAPRTGGVGAEIGALLMEHAFGHLDRPLRRLAIPDTPVPMADHLVDALAPSTADIVATVRALVG